MGFKADLLRAKLKEEGKTQKYLAERAGKTVRTVSRWLNGENPPKGKDLDVIARALNCRPQDFDPSYADEGSGVAIHARVSPASHNAYEVMRLCYGVTQKDIIELAPVLFSIVAARALKVPAEDIRSLKKAFRRGLPSDARSYEDAAGFEIDKIASKKNNCFGLQAEDPSEANPRNLFYEAVSRLSFETGNRVDTAFLIKPEAGEVPSATGFIADVDTFNKITGGDKRLTRALAMGRVRLSKCVNECLESKGDVSITDILHREMTHEAEKAAEARDASLVKLKAWRAFYEERHPVLAREYDKIVEMHCHPEGWFPGSYEEDTREALWVAPFLEYRFINDITLPGYEDAQAKGDIFLRENDPIIRRFRELRDHRRTSKVEYGELGK